MFFLDSVISLSITWSKFIILKVLFVFLLGGHLSRFDLRMGQTAYLSLKNVQMYDFTIFLRLGTGDTLSFSQPLTVHAVRKMSDCNPFNSFLQLCSTNLCGHSQHTTAQSGCNYGAYVVNAAGSRKQKLSTMHVLLLS